MGGVRLAVRDTVGYPLKRMVVLSGRHIEDLASNESSHGPHPAAARVARQGKWINGLNRYPDPTASRLTREIAKFHGLAPDNIVVFNGSEEGLRCAIEIYVVDGRELLTIVPTFPTLRIKAQIMGGKVVAVPLDSDYSYSRRTEREIIERMSEKTGLIPLCVPNNPTGTMVPIDSILRILRAAGKKHIVVLIDEAYAEFSGVSVVDLLHRFDNLIVARTFSKAQGLAGARIGYLMAVNPEIVENILKPRPVFSADALSQAMAIAALKNQGWVRKTVRKILRERERLVRALPSLGLQTFPSEANFLFVNVAPRTNIDFRDRLLEAAGILVREIALPDSECFVRITVGTEGQNNKLIAAIRRIM